MLRTSISLKPRLLFGSLSLVALMGLSLVPSPRNAEAFPPFTKKEGKPCGYCHVETKGGGARNYRGKFYDANNKTFAGFNDEAEAKKAGEQVGPFASPPPNSYTPPASAPTTPPATTPTEAPTPSPAKPSGMGTSALKAKVATTSAAYNRAKTPANKKAYGAAVANLAHAMMLDQSVPPAKRYPQALKMVRQALAIDPTNKTAAADKKMIEGVYKQMGRPIPK